MEPLYIVLETAWTTLTPAATPYNGPRNIARLWNLDILLTAISFGGMTGRIQTFGELV